jgi:bifunctional DNA-binding transcriptional regulator/antitoxin component of YhaV-PrlF toxin-antitoxin module
MPLKIRPAWSDKAGYKGGAIISLPLKDRKISGLSVGDIVEIEASPNQIIIRKMEVVKDTQHCKTIDIGEVTQHDS